MSALMTIELKDLLFHSKHGLFPEERKTGNEFRVQVKVEYVPDSVIISSIDETINYATLFALVKAYMDEPHDLLETVAMKIGAAVQSTFPQIRKITISIDKLHPPIIGCTGAVGITWSQEC